MYVKPDKPIELIDVMKVFGDRVKDIPAVDWAAISGIAGRTTVNVDSSRVNSTYAAATGAETDPYGTAANGSIMRPIGVLTSSTCHFIEMPDGKYAPKIAGRGWFTMGPAEFALWLPHYGLITEPHEYFTTETRFWGFQPESAYWIFHDLSKMCRSNREYYGWPVRDFWIEYDKKLIAEQGEVEAKLLALYAKDPAAATKWINDYHWKTDNEAFRVAKLIRTALVEFISDHVDSNRDPTQPSVITDKFVVPDIKFLSALDMIDEGLPFSDLSALVKSGATVNVEQDSKGNVVVTITNNLLSDYDGVTLFFVDEDGNYVKVNRTVGKGTNGVFTITLTPDELKDLKEGETYAVQFRNVEYGTIDGYATFADGGFTYTSDGGSSGCDVGFGVFALILVAGALLFSRKRG
jgi:hypothetical protein